MFMSIVYALFILDDMKRQKFQVTWTEVKKCNLPRKHAITIYQKTTSLCIITFYNFKISNVGDVEIGLPKHVGVKHRQQQVAKHSSS